MWDSTDLILLAILAAVGLVKLAFWWAIGYFAGHTIEQVIKNVKRDSLPPASRQSPRKRR